MSPETTTPSTVVLMPKLGQAMTEGTVLQWHKQDGEQVKKGEILVTIETDKATYDLEAQASGTIRIYVEEGQEVKVGAIIGEIGDGQGRVMSTTPIVAPVAPTVTVSTTEVPARKRILASPKAKQLAAEHGINLATVTPSGTDGVIAADDVERALAAQKTTPPIPLGERASVGRVVRERRKLTGIRKTSARRLQEAWQTIPHIVQMVEVDAAALRETRAALRTEIPSLTLNDLILYAAAHVMASLPDLNGAIEGEELVLYDGIDIGFAVDTPRGLVAPVIRRAETLSLAQLAAESQRLIEAARRGRLGPEYIGGASVTVSNLGMFGVQFGTPVINLGEPVLVFVGAMEDRPVVRDGQIVIRPLMTLSIGYDHRVADGVAASQFTKGLKERLENPASKQSAEFRAPSSEASTQHLTPNTQEELGEREIRSIYEGDGYAVQVGNRAHQWVIDEPVEGGGTDRGPTPVDAFVGALLSCMTISFKATARRRKVQITKMEGYVRAHPGRITTITMKLEAWSPDPTENVQALLDTAKRGCYVSGVLKPEIDFQVELVVHKA
ncbi:MAG: 2-oxo acid dehydrogenase subunit E2 [Candidatus Binatia bacterium]